MTSTDWLRNPDWEVYLYYYGDHDHVMKLDFQYILDTYKFATVIPTNLVFFDKGKYITGNNLNMWRQTPLEPPAEYLLFDQVEFAKWYYDLLVNNSYVPFKYASELITGRDGPYAPIDKIAYDGFVEDLNYLIHDVDAASAVISRA